jgi:hypothetical protein
VLLTPFKLALRCAVALATGQGLILPSAHSSGSLFAANAAFVVAFEFLACTLVVYAVRALRDYQPHKEKLHDRFRRLTIWGLWLALAGGVAESVVGHVVFRQPTAAWGLALLGVASAVRWLGISALLGFWLFALAKSSRKAGAGEVAPAPAE